MPQLTCTLFHSRNNNSNKKWANNNNNNNNATASTTRNHHASTAGIEQDAATTKQLHDRMLFLLGNLTVSINNETCSVNGIFIKVTTTGHFGGSNCKRRLQIQRYLSWRFHRRWFRHCFEIGSKDSWSQCTHRQGQDQPQSHQKHHVDFLEWLGWD